MTSRFIYVTVTYTSMQSLPVHCMAWPLDLDRGTQVLSSTMVGGAEIAEHQIQEEMKAILMAVMARMEERERGKMDMSDEEGTDYVPEQTDEVDGRNGSAATNELEQRNCSPMHVCQPVTTGGDLSGLQEKEAGASLFNNVSPLGM